MNSIKMKNSKSRISAEGERGVVALSLTIIIMLVSAAIVISLFLVFFNRIQSATSLINSNKSYVAAESGVEDYLLRFADENKDIPAGTYSFYVDSASTTVEVTELAGGDRKVVATGSLFSSKRLVEIIIDKSTTNASFVYGAQVGRGGLTMQNNSKVQGSVYSNGDIDGDNGPIITGDAFAAQTSTVSGIEAEGKAQGYTLDNTSTTNNSVAHSLNDCIVGGDAFYEDSITNCTVSGATTQESYSQLEEEEMPISDDTIEDWKNEAEDGEVISSGDTRCIIGDDSNTESYSVGPAKFECDLTIQNKGQLIVDGFIWVDGDITLQNQAVVKLDSSFGESSSAVIADDSSDSEGGGVVQIQNSAEVRGSGDNNSFLSMTSMNDSSENGGDTTAISVSNGTASSIFFAPHGHINLQNNIDLVEVTGYSLELANSAVVEYQQGLSDIDFSSGPTGGFLVTGWKEI